MPDAPANESTPKSGSKPSSDTPFVIPGIWETFIGRLFLVGLSIIPMVLCVADYDIWPLGFVAWIPLLAAVEGLRPRGALFYGWLIGTGTVFWGFFWMTNLLEKFAGFPEFGAELVALLFASYHGLLWGLAAMLTRWLDRKTTVPIWVTAPLCWVAMEATLPNIFPIYMAQGWAAAPLLIQTAEIGGVTTVSFIMVAINAGLYALWRHWMQHRAIDKRAAAFTATLLVLVPGYGALRMAQVRTEMDEAPHLKIGVVQGNMSIMEMAQRRNKLDILARQRRMSAKLQEKGAQLVLWGETAYPHGRVFARQSVQEPPPGNPWRMHADGFSVPLLVGVVTHDATGKSPYPWNTALLLDGEGRIQGHYDKVYRLIFGEYIPLVDPAWYLEQVPSASHLEKGEGPKALPFGEYRLGPFICYEDILPRYVRETANQGVNVFLNLTNDAWFGKTHEPAQHLGLAVFRAVEHRKGLLRSVNTGISVYVDPTGVQHDRTILTDPDLQGPQKAVGFVADVPMMDPDSRTLYGRTGELFNILCIGLVMFIGWRGPRRPVPLAHAPPVHRSDPAHAGTSGAESESESEAEAEAEAEAESESESEPREG